MALSVFLPLAGLPGILFVLITWQIVVNGPLVRVDERLSHVLVHPDRGSEILSDLGSVQVALPVLMGVIVYVALRGRRDGMDRWWVPPLAAALLMALVPALIVPLKDWTARHGTPAMPPGVGYYPSGHTATATVAYGAGTLLLLCVLDHIRRALLGACVAVNLGVGFGLVRHGYHWPLDVVASWCLGVVLLASLWLLISRTTLSRTTLGRTALSRSSRRTSSGNPGSGTGPG